MFSGPLTRPYHNRILICLKWQMFYLSSVLLKSTRASKSVGRRGVMDRKQKRSNNVSGFKVYTQFLWPFFSYPSSCYNRMLFQNWHNSSTYDFLFHFPIGGLRLMCSFWFVCCCRINTYVEWDVPSCEPAFFRVVCVLEKSNQHLYM